MMWMLYVFVVAVVWGASISAVRWMMWELCDMRGCDWYDSDGHCWHANWVGATYVFGPLSLAVTLPYAVVQGVFSQESLPWTSWAERQDAKDKLKHSRRMEKIARDQEYADAQARLSETMQLSSVQQEQAQARVAAARAMSYQPF